MSRTIKAADLFCGGGGTSQGIVEACADLGIKLELSAWNHWDVAIATSSTNHPDARHFCASLDNVNPREAYKEGDLDLLWASPECTHHSIARGGKPVSDQSRSTAWCVVRWAEALRPPTILVENVKEFLSWGPLIRVKRKVKVEVPKLSFRKWKRAFPGKTKRKEWHDTCPKQKREVTKLVFIPDPKHKGEIFAAWVKCLESIGYRVDWRILCAADYGDPTTRQRLFVQAVFGRRKIVWPNQSHRSGDENDLFGNMPKWVSARAIIDWSIEGKSIFHRKRPLAEKTLNRIFIGLEKFGLKPFICGAGGPTRSGEPLSVEDPMRTVLTRNHSYVVQPFLAHLRGNCDAKSVDRPAPTLTAGGGHLALVEPFLVQTNHGNGADPKGDERRSRSIDKPLPTVMAATTGEWAVCEPMLLGQQSGAAARPVSEPVPTVATAGAISLAEPFLIAIDHRGGNGNQARSIDTPVSAVTTKQRHALCEPFLLSAGGPEVAPRPVSQPVNTVLTRDHMALCEPYLTKFYGNSSASSIDAPVDTVTCKDRFGLCMPTLEIDGDKYLLDIRFRMLQPHELAAAQGFPKGYKFSGKTTEIVKQIGNAVPKNLAKALVRAALSQSSQ